MTGLGYAAAAYLLWGGISLYFKAVAALPAPETLGHRVLWSLVVTAVAVAILAPKAQVVALFADRRKIWGLGLSALLLSSNWLMFIWAVVSGQALEAGLGYFICPLMSVGLGAVFFRERLSRGQVFGILIVAIGVGISVAAFGRPPWIALFLAGTFSLYGMARKSLGVPALLGLFVETLLMVPIALGYLLWLELSGAGHFLSAPLAFQGLVALIGIVTTVPLLFFAGAANRLDLTSLGLMQYLNPTVQVSLAVLVYGEAFTTYHALTFAAIWAGLAIFSLSAWAARRRGAPEAAPAGPLDN